MSGLFSILCPYASSTCLLDRSGLLRILPPPLSLACTLHRARNWIRVRTCSFHPCKPRAVYPCHHDGQVHTTARSRLPGYLQGSNVPEKILCRGGHAGWFGDDRIDTVTVRAGNARGFQSFSAQVDGACVHCAPTPSKPSPGFRVTFGLVPSSTVCAHPLLPFANIPSVINKRVRPNEHRHTFFHPSLSYGRLPFISVGASYNCLHLVVHYV